MKRRDALALLSGLSCSGCALSPLQVNKVTPCIDPLFDRYALFDWRDSSGGFTLTDGCGQITRVSNAGLAYRTGNTIVGVGDDCHTLLIERGMPDRYGTKELVMISLRTGALRVVSSADGSYVFKLSKSLQFLGCITYGEDEAHRYKAWCIKRLDYSDGHWKSISPIYKSKTIPNQISLVSDESKMVFSVDQVIHQLQLSTGQSEVIGEGRFSTLSDNSELISFMGNDNIIRIAGWPSLTVIATSDVRAIDGMRWFPNRSAGVFASHFPSKSIAGLLGIDTLYWLELGASKSEAVSTQRHSIGVMAFSWLSSDTLVVDRLRGLQSRLVD